MTERRLSWAALRVRSPVHVIALLVLLFLPEVAATQDVVNGRLLQLRREYNDVTAAIDTLVHVYGAERIAQLTHPERTLVQLPPDHRLVMLIWADDEARVYLNGAPVGETRLTPTRIEIPLLYVQQSNELSLHAWDTDRVEAAVMLGLYVEDPGAILHPVVTTLEKYGWATPDAQQGMEIFYAHSIPDLPAAQPMWGPHLFGQVWLSTHFDADQVMAAVQAPGAAAPRTATRDHVMDFHRNVSRLLGLQEQRGRLKERLNQMATRPDPHLRVRRARKVSPLSYTLGQAAPFTELAALETILDPLQSWRQELPAEQQRLIDHEARVLKGPEAATPVAPMETAKAASERGERTSQYTPPAEQGEVRLTQDSGARYVRTSGPSSGFLWRMLLISIALATWVGVASWRWWLLYSRVQWSTSAVVDSRSGRRAVYEHTNQVNP